MEYQLFPFPLCYSYTKQVVFNDTLYLLYGSIVTENIIIIFRNLITNKYIVIYKKNKDC